METNDIPTLSGVEAVILALLIAAARETYGLDLVKRSDGQLKRGTVYVTLSRMEDKGFVESRPESEPLTPAMPRRLYKITALGQRVLHAREVSRAILAGGLA